MSAPAPLPAVLRSRLAAEVKKHGEETIRKRMTLARDSFARALGGLTISRGTAAIIQQALDSMGAAPAPYVSRRRAIAEEEAARVMERIERRAGGGSWCVCADPGHEARDFIADAIEAAMVRESETT